jgi:carbonic anhydrase/acetyltransferase-like protein (isoleucine patch superfamily)
MPVTVARQAAVCEEAELQGVVSVGAQSVVHPTAAVRALLGRVTIGRRSLVEDRAVLEAPDAAGMAVGDSNLIEAGCVVRASRIGNGNWFEPKVQVGAGAVIGDNCLIGSGVVIAPGESVPDNTIIVSVDTPAGVRTRVVREQKDYLVRAHEVMIQKYVDSLTNPKSAYALEKHHRLLPASQA